MFSRKLLPAPLGIGLLARSQLYEIKAGFRMSYLMKKSTEGLSNSGGNTPKMIGGGHTS